MAWRSWINPTPELDNPTLGLDFSGNGKLFTENYEMSGYRGCGVQICRIELQLLRPFFIRATQWEISKRGNRSPARIATKFYGGPVIAEFVFLALSKPENWKPSSHFKEFEIGEKGRMEERSAADCVVSPATHRYVCTKIVTVGDWWPKGCGSSITDPLEPCLWLSIPTTWTFLSLRMSSRSEIFLSPAWKLLWR